MLLRSLLLFLFALCASTGVADERDTSLNASSLFRYPPKAFANHTKQVPTDNVWKAATEDDDNLTPDQRWCRYISRGTSLMKAMMMSEMEARLELNWSYVQSPWDGGMEKELQSWGYLDSEELHLDHDGDCDFDTKHKLGNVFRDTDKLNTDPRSSGQGGPNHCFYIQHSDSPAMIRSQDDEMPDVADQRYWVNDKEYRVRKHEWSLASCVISLTRSHCRQRMHMQVLE